MAEESGVEAVARLRESNRDGTKGEIACLDALTEAMALPRPKIVAVPDHQALVDEALAIQEDNRFGEFTNPVMTGLLLGAELLSPRRQQGRIQDYGRRAG